MNGKSLIHLVLLATTLFYSDFSFGQSTACATATALSVNTTCTFQSFSNTDNGSSSLVAPSCATGNNSEDVWYSVLGTGEFFEITVSGSNTDFALAMYTSCVATSSAHCAMASSGTDASITFPTNIGTTYYIRVQRRSGNNAVNQAGNICAAEVNACGNYLIAEAFCSQPGYITQGPGNLSGTTLSSYPVDEYPGFPGWSFCLIEGGTIENNSWYQFTASSTSELFSFVVLNCVGGAVSMQATVYEVMYDLNGCCVGFNQTANCGAFPSTANITAVGLTPGLDYLLMVDGGLGSVCDYEILNWQTATPLPVELVDFSGLTMEHNNELIWRTSSERDNDYFDILRTTDGIEFETIGKVEGNGNSTSLIDYNFTDHDIFPGIAYYALDQVDFNGERTRSELISLNRSLETSQSLFIWPNPFNNAINYQLGDLNGGTIQVVDNVGRVLISARIQANDSKDVFSLSTSDLLPGRYLFVYRSNSGKRVSKQIFKE